MTKISVRPKSIDIKIDGKSPSDWFAELEKMDSFLIHLDRLKDEHNDSI